MPYKTLKPKKPTMKNLDRELMVDFISKLLTSHSTELVSKIQKLPDTYEDDESAVFRTTKKEIIEIINQEK